MSGANRVTGEASVTLADKSTLTLAYDFDALIRVEELAGMSMSDVIDKSASGMPPMKVLKALWLAGLDRHHGDIGDKEATDLILPNIAAVAAGIQQGMANAFGGPGAEAGEDPPRAARQAPGTGTRSSKRGPKRG